VERREEKRREKAVKRERGEKKAKKSHAHTARSNEQRTTQAITQKRLVFFVRANISLLPIPIGSPRSYRFRSEPIEQAVCVNIAELVAQSISVEPTPAECKSKSSGSSAPWKNSKSEGKPPSRGENSHVILVSTGQFFLRATWDGRKCCWLLL